MLVSFTLDGRAVHVDPEVATTLLDLLRDNLGATAPKAGCGVGRCGACVILLDGRPVNACLVAPDRLEGSAVVTRDGLPESDLAPVVAALRRADAVQCGACAAGLTVTLAWLGRMDPLPTPAEVESAVAGHLCRCTGYVGIRAAISALFARGA